MKAYETPPVDYLVEIPINLGAYQRQIFSASFSLVMI